MIGEMIFLGKLIFGTALVCGGIVLVSFLKDIFNKVVLPIIEPILPILGDMIFTLIAFVQDTISTVFNEIIDILLFVKDTLLGVIANYKKISYTEVEATHEIYTKNEKNEVVRNVVTSIVDLDDLPDYVKNNLERTFYHDKELIDEVQKKLELKGVLHV